MTKKMDFFRLFLYLCLFNGLFLSLQMALILKNSITFLHTVHMPWATYLEMAAGLLFHVGLYLGLSIIQAFIVQSLPFKNQEKSMLWVWALSIAALLSANAWFFPASQFSQLFSPLMPHHLILAVMVISLSLLSIAGIYTAYKNKLPAMVILLGLIFSTLVPHSDKPLSNIPTASKKPNIIFIGIDSLTPNKITTTQMPHLNSLLKKSTIFSETISPLARTYPAWVSILTGQYPRHHHARYNLTPSELVKKENNLVETLGSKGYQTLFATDERRFNSIDKDFGFQQVIGPRFGVNDILIGSYNDYPLINLMVNFRISRRLLPYNYLNRGAFYHYYPETFNHEIEHALLKHQGRPLFLAVHYTLPHWPYAYARTNPKYTHDLFDFNGKQMSYRTALAAVDEQLFQLYSFLKLRGFLNNAIIVLLSDHGETLLTPGSRPLSPAKYQGKNADFADYIQRKTATSLDTSAGHGSDLLSPDQFHCLLAFQIFQQQQEINKIESIKQRVSLLDIRPTIEDFIQNKQKNAFDGLSLKSVIMGKQENIIARDFYLESGMLPNQSLSKEKAQQIARQLFEVDSKGKLQLKIEQIKQLDQLKLYGILSGPWLLATYPDDQKLIQVLLDLHSKRWSDDPESDLFKEAHAERLFKKLNAFHPVQTIPQATHSS